MKWMLLGLLGLIVIIGICAIATMDSDPNIRKEAQESWAPAFGTSSNSTSISTSPPTRTEVKMSTDPSSFYHPDNYREGLSSLGSTNARRTTPPDILQWATKAANSLRQRFDEEFVSEAMRMTEGAIYGSNHEWEVTSADYRTACNRFAGRSGRDPYQTLIWEELVWKETALLGVIHGGAGGDPLAVMRFCQKYEA